MNTNLDFPRLFAEKLNSDIIKIEEIAGGKNSRIFKIEDSKGNKLAAKIYYSHRDDPRDRLRTEFNAMNFLWDNNIKSIPKPILADSVNGFAIYEYIDGSPPMLSEISYNDIDQACEFLMELGKLKTHVDAAKSPPASEAVFSMNDLCENLGRRYNRLMALPKNSKLVHECQTFLKNQVYPFYLNLLNWSQEKLFAAGIQFDSILPQTERALSPSDFGFHNAIRRSDGKLVFLDFEYFGWDDPAKMISDFVLHPGMKLSFELKQRFVDRMLETPHRNDILRIRLSAFLPLFGIKWCFILLNEFIPADMTRREFSSNSSDNLEKKKINQLKKARAMLNEVASNYEKFFNFN